MAIQRAFTREEFFEAWSARGFCPLLRSDGAVKTILELKPPGDPSSIGDIALKDGWYSISELVESGFLFALDKSALSLCDNPEHDEDAMNECCTLDNMDAATATGKLDSMLNCLTCRTCKTQQTFTYTTEDEMNLCWSYVRLGVERAKKYRDVIHSPVPKAPANPQPASVDQRGN